MAATIQHITYNEFLPMVLGKDMMQKHSIILEKRGYFGGYDPKMDPSMSDDFVTSAFRFGHSLLPHVIERWSPASKHIASQRLSQMLRKPYDLYKAGWCDQYLMGLINQVAQAMDDAITQEVTNHLFQEPNKRFGMDLAAINMQRGREHGVNSYNAYREFCGYPRARHFDDLLGVMSNRSVARYRDIYRHPDDIDLWSGGVSERPLPGSMIGPTFSCLIGLQFKELRYGDRFWYENSGYPSQFTPDQLEELRKIKLSRVICDNSDDIKTIQIYAMVLPDHEIKEQAHATVECGTESRKQCELDGDVDEELEKNLHSWTQLDVQDNVPLSPDMFPMEHRQIWVDLFIRYNTPVPSSAAVERLFSMGSDVMRPKRSSLTAKNFEKLVFLKGNMNLHKGRWELEDSDEED
ncbi:Thyroid peroxidase [Chionoecetes opilio]|uniref:Thyroid peroxidase n=1 Tax=Chionoecetes opilio TaxID=41210 RepID=A0A8J5CTC1_CHIOP|nr:Thyroid peroxidase [Chionoecetes opilio]